MKYEIKTTSDFWKDLATKNLQCLQKLESLNHQPMKAEPKNESEIRQEFVVMNKRLKKLVVRYNKSARDRKENVRLYYNILGVLGSYNSSNYFLIDGQWRKFDYPDCQLHSTRISVLFGDFEKELPLEVRSLCGKESLGYKVLFDLYNPQA